MFRFIFLAAAIAIGGAMLSSCASTRPEDVPVPAPILAKTAWDDASGHGAPADSIGRNLIKLLSRRDDMVVSEEGSAKDFHPPRLPGEGGAPRKGSRHGGGGGMPGEGEYGSRMPGKSMEMEHRSTSLQLLLAGTVERWDVDSERTAFDASVGSDPSGISISDPSVKLSVRLVSKATGRVVWRKSEACSPAMAIVAALGDSARLVPADWTARFERCGEEVLRTSARDVSAAVLDLARQAAISEAAASKGR